MHEIIAKRHSARSFLPNPVPPHDVQEMLEAFRWAPSAKNLQPWRVVLSTGNKLLPALSRGNAAWAPNAPVAFVVCGLSDPEAKPGREANYIFDVGLATENLILQAVAMGYATQPTGGWDEEKVREILRIPADIKVLCIIFIGKPGNSDDLDERSKEKLKQPRVRKELSEIAFEGEWGKSLPSP